MDRSRTRRVLVSGLAVVSLVALGACSQEYYDQHDGATLGAGNANEVNKAMQTIDPWPEYAGKVRHKTDGERIGVATERYKTNKSLEPEGLTSDSEKQGEAGEGDTAQPGPEPN